MAPTPALRAGRTSGWPSNAVLATRTPTTAATAVARTERAATVRSFTPERTRGPSINQRENRSPSTAMSGPNTSSGVGKCETWTTLVSSASRSSPSRRAPSKVMCLDPNVR